MKVELIIVCIYLFYKTVKDRMSDDECECYGNCKNCSCDCHECDNYYFARPPIVKQINHYHPHRLSATYFEDSDGWRGFFTDEGKMTGQYNTLTSDVVYFDKNEKEIK